MNVETGAIYRGQAAIESAIGRGEPVVAVSERVATMMELGKNAESAESVSIADLQKRIEALEGKDALEQRMKSLGLVMPQGAEGLR